MTADRAEVVLLVRFVPAHRPLLTETPENDPVACFGGSGCGDVGGRNAPRKSGARSTFTGSMTTGAGPVVPVHAPDGDDEPLAVPLFAVRPAPSPVVDVAPLHGWVRADRPVQVAPVAVEPLNAPRWPPAPAVVVVVAVEPDQAPAVLFSPTHVPDDDVAGGENTPVAALVPAAVPPVAVAPGAAPATVFAPVHVPPVEVVPCHVPACISLPAAKRRGRCAAAAVAGCATTKTCWRTDPPLFEPPPTGSVGTVA